MSGLTVSLRIELENVAETSRQIVIGSCSMDLLTLFG